jgi:hypothetical protein
MAKLPFSRTARSVTHAVVCFVEDELLRLCSKVALIELNKDALTILSFLEILLLNAKLFHRELLLRPQK